MNENKEVEKVEKETLKKILYKYGFHSLNKEPFLYVKNEEIGISFSFKDPFYGELNRVFFPKNIEAAEDFLAKYSWYKKNGQKYQVNIKLSDYKKEDPDIVFEKDNKVYSLEELKKIPEEKIEILTVPKEDKYIKKLKRSLLLLLEIIKEKIKIQEDTYQNLGKLSTKYYTKYNYYENLKKEFYKLKEAQFIKEELLDPMPDMTEQLTQMAEEIKEINDPQKLESQITVFTEFIEKLELSESLIKNKYELIRLPLEIDRLNKKIEILEKAIKRKKGWFNKRENIDEELKEIEKESIVNQIVSYEQYKANEQSRVKEKYAMVPDLDKRTVGDFLIEFDNLKVKEPILEKEIEEEKQYSYEETMTELEENFQKRSSEEKRILTLYHSFIRQSLITSKSIREKDVEEFINTIENPNNILMKLKYFKNIDTSSTNKCIESIRTEIEKIKSIKEDILKSDINVFFKENKYITAENFLATSTKRILSPSQNDQENDINYIALVKKDTYVYFAPIEITYDLENDDTLIQKNNQPFFLIDVQKNRIHSENSDIIKIVRYQTVKEKENNLTIVTDLKRVKIDEYRYVTIERKE